MNYLLAALGFAAYLGLIYWIGRELDRIEATDWED